MKTNRKAAVLALGLALLSPLAGAELVDTEWWKVDFTSPTPEGTNEQGAVVGDVELFDGDSVSVLTNTIVSTVGDVTYKPAYASGIWRMADGDESVITNSVVTNALEGTSEESLHIKLDTQGNDLVWAPSNGVSDVINLVDADLLLVGSDSAPDHEDFDPTNATKRVQTAIFLKNATDEESGETTNSVLCVYSRNTNTGKNEWMELTGDVKIEDNSWHHVQVSIDYTGKSPVVVVKVDGKTMTLVSGGEITAANPTESKTAAKVQEVCFRGTGAVDNFVGTSRVVNPDSAWFEAKVFWDDTEMKEEDGWDNSTLIVQAGVGEDGKSEYAVFPDFLATDADYDYEEDPSWCLDRVELFDLTTPGTKRTFGYYWNDKSFKIAENEENEETSELDLREQGGWQTGMLLVKPCTDGAIVNETNLIAKIYFKTLGAFYANKVTEINGSVETNGTLLKPVAAGGTYPTNLVWTFPATDGANVLTGVKVENGATATYDSATRVATATVTLATALETNKTFVTATYAEGSYEGKTPTWIDNEDGTYVLGNYVAKIDGDPKPVFYETLAAAISAVPTDGTETKVELIADITVPEGTTMFQTIGANRNVYLDFGGHTVDATAMTSQGIVFRVQGTALFTNGTVRATGWVAGVMATKATHQGVLTIADGTYVSTDADAIQIAGMPNDDFAGSLTIAGGSVEAAGYAVSYTEAGASVTVTGGTVTSHAAAAISGLGTAGCSGNTVTVTGGKLVADGVGLSAGSLCCGIYCPNADTVVFGDDAEIESAGAGIVACAGSVVVSGGTITTTGTAGGTIASNPDELPPAALVFDTKANYPGYDAETSKIAVSGGTFVSAVNPVQQVADEGDATAIAVSGGWFSAEVAEGLLVAGYSCDRSDDPPIAAAPYTVVLGNAIWIGGANGDWNVPANWDIGLVPTNTTVVTFTNDAQVAISGYDRCKEMVLTNAVVTLGGASGVAQPILRFYGDEKRAVSVATGATGLLRVNGISLFNEVKDKDDLTIGCGLEILGDVTFRGVGIDNSKSASFTITGKTTITNNVTVKTIDGGITTFQGDIDIASGAQVTFFAAYNPTGSNHGGEIVVASTVTLASPATKLLLQTRNNGKITINDSQVVTDSTDYYVKKSSQQNVSTENNGTVNQTTYEVLPKRTVVTVAATDVTVEGVSEGLLFVPGTNFVITVTGFGEGYEPSVMITNGTSVLLTTNAATFTYTAPDSDIGVVATKVAKIFDVIWVVEGSKVTNNVAYNVSPVYPGTPNPPTKPSTAEFDYEFAGWDPEVVAATGPATYTATFTPVPRSYTVTFWTNEVDVGTAYHSTNAPYGTHAAAYAPTNDPTRAATSTTNFTFAGWTNAVAGGAAVATADLPDVTTNAAWAAVWTETPIWTVTFKNGADTIYETNYLDGATAEYVGETPTKDSTAQYAYTFAGWDPALGAVTADTVYAATFSSNAVEYAITFWTNEVDVGTAYFATKAVYGATGYGPADPAKDGFTFAGWTNTVAGGAAVAVADLPAVAGAADWLAVWTEDAQAPEVNAGQGLDTYVPGEGEPDVPPAIEFVPGAAAGDPDRCAVSFVAPATGWYLLMVCDHVSADDADYQPDYGSKVEVTAATVLKPVTLVETSNATVKFFKIGWSKTEPVQP